MNGMFYNCMQLKSLELSHFKTPNLKAMNQMFYECNALTSLDITNFNTSQVTEN